MTADPATAGVVPPACGDRRSRRGRLPWRLAGVLWVAATLDAVALSAASPPAAAQPPETRAEQELSRGQAVAMVQQRYGARVVRADVADQNGRRLYVFRLLSA